MNIGILSPGDNIWRATLAVSTFYVCIQGFLIPFCFVMSVWDLSSDDGRDTAFDLTKTLDLTLCEPQAFSTAMENENKESGYATKPNETTNSPPLDENACVSEEMWNGQGNAELDQTVIDKRPRKLTEKGKGYRLVQRKGERNKLKRKIQSQIANISTLLGHDKNLELISDLSMKLNDLFEQFGDLHEEIQELLTKEEQIKDSEIMMTCTKKLDSFVKQYRSG